MESIGQEIWLVLGASVGVTLVSVLILWLVSIAIRDVSIIDMFFALILLSLTVIAALSQSGLLRGICGGMLGLLWYSSG